MVTGANSGIGKATALGLTKMGVTVVMVCRNRAKGEETRREIKEQSGNVAVDFLIADLSSQQAFRQLVQEFTPYEKSQLYSFVKKLPTGL